MSFGLGISFGRLCNRQRSLHSIYEEARRIEGWEQAEVGGWIREYLPKKGITFAYPKISKTICCTSE